MASTGSGSRLNLQKARSSQNIQCSSTENTNIWTSQYIHSEHWEKKRASVYSKEQKLKLRKKETQESQLTLLSVESLKTHGHTCPGCHMLATGKFSLLQGIQSRCKGILISSWVWTFSIQRSLHSPISGNTQ
jgi:hypothetical protein